jgi:hypothetical protein
MGQWRYLLQPRFCSARVDDYLLDVARTRRSGETAV